MQEVVRKNESCIVSIVLEIAEREGVEITELPPLYNVIDPDALVSVLDSEGITVKFSYIGYDVRVKSDDSILIDS